MARPAHPTRPATQLVAVLALAVIVALAGCGSDDAPSFESTFGSDPTPTTEASPEEAPTTEPADEPAAEEPTTADEPAAELPPVTIPDALNLELTTLIELDRPIDMASRPGNPNVFIATKGGLVVEVDISDDNEGAIIRELIDIADIIDDAFESGLLGITFSPDGDLFYLHYSDRDHNNNVVEIAMNGDELATDSGRTLLVVEQPADNHNGGDLAFGPDGLLYVTLGDGGGGGDPFENGQDTTTLLGSILRIDPAGEPYAIPPDNPFANGGGAQETYLYGVRNPWRISFDPATGDLWVADVGQDALEEVNVLYASEGAGLGANLGWNLVEGTAPFAAPGPPTSGYAGPIFEYGRDEGCSVTGGHVYRLSLIHI